VAKRVVGRGKHRLNNKQLDVKLFYPTRSTKQNSKRESKQESSVDQHNEPTAENDFRESIIAFIYV